MSTAVAGMNTTIYKVAELKTVADRRIRFVATRQEIDADQEVIITRGISLARFQKNPVLLLQHSRLSPIGRVESLTLQRVDGADALVGEGIIPKGTSTEAEVAYAQIKSGVLSGISIGFMPIEIDAAPVLVGQKGVTYRRVELMEVSVVSLPSCGSCVVTSKAARDPELIRFDAEDLRRALPGVLRSAVRDVVGGVVRRAIQAHRGRLD